MTIVYAATQRLHLPRPGPRAHSSPMAIRKTKIDGGLAWRWFAEPDPEDEYLAMATVIELRTMWGLPRFQWHTTRIHAQLAGAPGLLGFSFKAQFPLRYWTLSVWENGRALQRFVKGEPHLITMTAIRSNMRSFQHVHWKVGGTAVPLGWADGLRRLHDQHANRSSAA